MFVTQYMEPQPTFSEVIKNRGFRYLWFNQILVQLAYNTLNFAMLIWVFQLTGSTLAVAMLMVAVYLPSLLFGMMAGIYVDIADRRKIILVIDFLLALSFLLFIFIKDSYPLILINTFFINTLGQFFVPTESSSIPMLVKNKQLIIANSLFSLTLYGSFMIGFSLAGPIVNYQGMNAIFTIGMLAAIAAWIMALQLPIIQTSSGKKFQSLPSTSEIHQMYRLVINETKTAGLFIKGKVNVLAAILLMAGMQGVIGVLAVVISAYMETVLHIRATDASYVLMFPLGLGMIFGAYLIAKFGHNRPKRYIVIPSLIASGVLFVLAGMMPVLAEFFQAADLPSYIDYPRFFALAPSISTIFAIGSFLMGMAAVGIIVPSQTVLQQNTTEQNRGKIFAVLVVVMNLFAAVVSILAGVFADWLGAATIFAIMGILILPVGLFVHRPGVFFKSSLLPFRVRQFLGLGHWNR